MLNIEKLRLSDEMLDDLFNRSEYVDGTGLMKEAADAQLAKALWGVVEWLRAVECGRTPPPTLRFLLLLQALEAASIPRPSAEVAHG